MDDSRVLHRVVMRQPMPHEEGTLLSEAPRHVSMIELKRMAGDQKSWNRMVNKYKRYGVLKYTPIAN